MYNVDTFGDKVIIVCLLLVFSGIILRFTRHSCRIWDGKASNFYTFLLITNYILANVSCFVQPKSSLIN